MGLAQLVCVSERTGDEKERECEISLTAADRWGQASCVVLIRS